MKYPLNFIPPAPPTMPSDEWTLRLQLAATYRLINWFGWTNSIYSHVSVRVPGQDNRFLINPFGLNYDEVTASNLIKVDQTGQVVEASDFGPNLAGFVIHGAIHEAREDAHCIAHTHTIEGMAVAAKQGGLRYDNFHAGLLYGQIGYHDFEGVTTAFDERPRLVSSLGRFNILILRNHGLLAVGRTVPEMFSRLFTLQKACEIQCVSDAMAGESLLIPTSVLNGIAAQNAVIFDAGDDATIHEFNGFLRRARIAYADLV